VRGERGDDRVREYTRRNSANIACSATATYSFLALLSSSEGTISVFFLRTPELHTTSRFATFHRLCNVQIRNCKALVGICCR
jgi:hypothetical protein